jgi:hypothetical protein
LQLSNLKHVLAAGESAPTTSSDSSSRSSSADVLPVLDQRQQRQQQQQQRGWLLDDMISLCGQCSKGMLAATNQLPTVLSSSSGSSQDNTSGFQPAPASEQQQALAAILRKLQQLLDGALPQLQQQLLAIGVEVCNAIPLPWLCNNPHCVNLECGSELMLVGGKGCVCGGCRAAR